MNLENSLMGDRALFNDSLRLINNRIAVEVINLYADVIRSTTDNILWTGLVSDVRPIDSDIIAVYRLSVKFTGGDGVYCKEAKLSVKYNPETTSIFFEKEIFE